MRNSTSPFGKRVERHLYAVFLCVLLPLFLSASVLAQTNGAQCEPSAAINCPDDLFAHCNDDLSPELLESMPSVDIEDCDGTAAVSISYVDNEVGSADCQFMIARTWIVTVGDVTEMCTQVITVADFTGPSFVDFPEDIMVSCVEEIPAPVQVEAEDACNEVVLVDIFTSETGAPIEECVASTAFGPGDDWALWLPSLGADGLTASGNFLASELSFVMYADGTARLTGIATNDVDPSQQFAIDFHFENRRNWDEWSALGRSFKDSFGHAAAGGNLWETWSYFEMVNNFSTLTGLNSLAGNILYAQHMPDNYYFGFQCGQAANDINSNFGMSGWFTLNGVFNNEFITGYGDINVDKECEEIPLNECPNDTAVTYYYRAEDSCGNSTIDSYTVTVFDDIAPEFTVFPADLTVECSDPLPLAEEAELVAVDNCDCGIVSLDYLGQFMVEGGNSCEYQLERVWLAVDCCSNQALHVQIITVVDTTAPEATFVPADITYECDEVFDGVPVALAAGVDNCQDDVTVTYDDLVIDGDCPQEYVIERTFYLNDGCGNIAVVGPQIISVVDTTAPVFGPYQVQVSVECTDVDTVEGPEATDNCGEVTIEVSEVLQSGGCIGVLVRTYTATDECGNVATAQQFITLLDTTPPVIFNPEDATVECDEVPAAPGADGIEIFDNCGYPVEVEFTETIIEGDCLDNYTIVWTWVATDFCENTSTATTTITVEDTTPPVFVTLPEDAIYECDEDVPACGAELVEATDNCAENVVIECTDMILAGDCPNTYTIQRLFRAFDNCGNQTMHVQTIEVVDTTAPVFATSNETAFTYECDENIPVIQPVATDNCGEVELTFVNGSMVAGECPQEYSFERTWTAIDECDNASTFVQLINVVDTTAPVISGDFQVSAPCDDYDNQYITAVDNCSEDLTIVWEDQQVSGGCAGNILRTYFVTDECGNEATFVQIINLTDEEAPEILDGPSDLVLECTEAVPACDISLISAIDNCDDDLSISCEDEIVAGDCPQNYTIVRTYTVTDHCENSVTHVQTITVQDTTAPEFTVVPEDAIYECNEDVPACGDEEVAATDNCGEVSISCSDVIADGDCPQNYTITRTFTAVDECGNATVHTQTITVADTTAPVFATSNETAFTYECDENIPVIQPVATDNCSEVDLTFVNGSMVAGECPQEYSFERTWTAIDECNNASTFTQTINVVDTTAPVISGDLQLSAPCDDYDNQYITAEDNCSEDLTIVWQDQQVSGGCAGTILRTYTVTDECGNEAIFDQIINLTDEEAPEILDGPSDLVLECTEAVPACDISLISAIDNCDDDLSISCEDEIVASGCPQNYTVVRTYTVTDHCENSVTHVQTITVQDTTAPEFTVVPANATYECDEDVPACGDEEVVATDNCGEVSISCSDVVADGDCLQNYTITRTFTAVDECGNATVHTQTITVADTTAPVFATSNETAFTYECDENIPVIQPVANDNCSEVDLTFVDGSLVEGDCPQEYSFERTWTATDECGNASTFVQLINVVDTTAPVIEGPLQLSWLCDDIDHSFIEVTDNCSEEVNVIWTDMMLSGGCANTIIRDYVVTDECGNEATFQQIISLVDNEAPVFVSGPEAMTYECSDEIPAGSIEEVVVTDNCTAFVVTVADAIIDGDCPHNYTIVRTWTAVDQCQNASTYVQNITVEDTTAPEFTVVPADATYECDEQVPACGDEEVAAIDNCGEVSISCSDVVADGDCPQNYTITRTFTAVDECGNATVHTQTITVADTTAPVFASSNETAFTYECSEEIPAIDPVATDNCSEVQLTFVDGDAEEGECAQEYGFVRTWTATDACGNASTFVQLINVVDTTAPELIGTGDANLVLDCEDEIPAPSDVTALDACEGELEVIFTEELIGDVPAEGSAADCVASTPAPLANGIDCTNYEPWSVVLFGLSGNSDSRYTTLTANWVEYPDGSATLTGIVVNQDNPNAGWEVTASFSGGLTWEEWSTQAFPTSFKDDCNLDGGEHLDWIYYTQNLGATLFGWGDYEGAVLVLAHAPANFFYGFQVGVGANNVNMNYGGGGWFTYTGSFNGQEVTGAGDFAFDFDCCPQYHIERTWCALDCAGNETCFTQIISFEALESQLPQPGFEAIENADFKGDFQIVSLAPNPSASFTRVTIESRVNQVVRLEIFDLNGRVVDVIYEGQLFADQTITRVITTEHLQAGMYTVRVASPWHADFRKLIVIR